MQVVQEFAGSSGTVGAHQYLRTGQVPVGVVEGFGQLGQCLGEQLNMVTGRVGSLITGAHQHR